MEYYIMLHIFLDPSTIFIVFQKSKRFIFTGCNVEYLIIVGYIMNHITQFLTNPWLKPYAYVISHFTQNGFPSVE